MSYPATLQTLVIEDEEGPKVAYEEIFKKLASESGGLPFRPALPRFAFSYEQAVRFVEGSEIFHLAWYRDGAAGDCSMPLWALSTPSVRTECPDGSGQRTGSRRTE